MTIREELSTLPLAQQVKFGILVAMEVAKQEETVVTVTKLRGRDRFEIPDTYFRPDRDHYVDILLSYVNLSIENMDMYEKEEKGYGNNFDAKAFRDVCNFVESILDRNRNKIDLEAMLAKAKEI